MNTADSGFSRNEIWPLDKKVLLRSKLPSCSYDGFARRGLRWRRKTFHFSNKAETKCEREAKNVTDLPNVSTLRATMFNPLKTKRRLL